MFEHNFYFLRHGETDGNLQEIVQGDLDIPLNETGRQQALQAANILKTLPIDRIVASPLRRARETTEIINRILQKPVEYHAGLAERDWGVFLGKTPAEITVWKQNNDFTDDPDEPPILNFSSPPGDETYVSVRKRLIDAITDKTSEYPDQSILFIAHGHSFRILYYDLFKEKKISGNAQPYYFNKNKGDWQVEAVGVKDKP